MGENRERNVIGSHPSENPERGGADIEYILTRNREQARKRAQTGDRRRDRCDAWGRWKKIYVGKTEGGSDGGRANEQTRKQSPRGSRTGSQGERREGWNDLDQQLCPI